MENNKNINIEYVDVSVLKPADYNPRKWDEAAIKNLTESIKKYGLIDPVIANNAPQRYGVVIGGHFRLKVAKDLGIKQIPVVWIKISDL